MLGQEEKRSTSVGQTSDVFLAEPQQVSSNQVTKFAAEHQQVDTKGGQCSTVGSDCMSRQHT